MAKVITLLVFLFFSVSFNGQNFERRWKKTIEYEEIGSIKSAFKEVDKIYNKAKRKSNEVEIIKSFFFRSKYIQILEEDAQSKIVKNLQSDISEISEPGKSILEYVYILSLNDYLRKNKYRIQRRTATENTFNPEFQSWTLPDFEREIDKYINSFLQKNNSDKFQNTAIKDFQPILDFEKLENIEDKKLYEFLLQKYIEIYTSHLIYWNSVDPQYHNARQLIQGTTSDFLSVKFDTFSNNNLKKASVLFQELERADPQNKRLSLNRLQFFEKYAFKDPQLFLGVMNDFQKTIKDHSLSQEVQLIRAELYEKLASKEKHPDYNKIAIRILDSILMVESRSNSYKNAFIRRKHLLDKEVKVRLLKFTYENENTRTFVTFKNADSLHLRAYKVPLNFELGNTAILRDSLISALIKESKEVVHASYKLPVKNDHFSYSTEIQMPLLKKGKYLLLFDPDLSGFEKIGNYSGTFIAVSDLSILHNKDNNKNHFQVVHRKTGIPIENVKLQTDEISIHTNKNGIATIPVEKSKLPTNRYSLIHATSGKDTLQVGYYRGYYRQYTDDGDDEEFTGKVQFLLDRAIYRPGQKVYAKGIALQKKNGIKSIVPNLTVWIEISDANYNTIKEFEIQTNDFGSFNFDFIVPKNGLTGTYHIEADEPDIYENDPLFDPEEDDHLFWDYADFDNSAINFSVEEYKRPTFKIDFDPIKENTAVNQMVSVSGKAISFSGVHLDDSKVTYRVERKSYPNYWRIYYPEETKTLVEGETMTENDGSFKIEFEAIPYAAMDKKELPVFHYTVYADITDSRGETQSSQTTVKVGYHTLALASVIPDVINTKIKDVLTLNSTNLNGEFMAVKGRLDVYYQSALDTKFKNRIFPIPDIPGFTEEEFEKLFPYEKNNDSNVNLETLVFSKEINTETDSEISLDFLEENEIGNYKLVFSAMDSEQNLIKTSKNFKLIHTTEDLVNKLFTINQLNDNPYKDGFAELEIRSKIKTLFLNISDNRNPTFNLEHVWLNNGSTKVKIPVDPNGTDNIALTFESYFENQFYTESFTIAKKAIDEIDIAIKTFRNRIEPGSKQTWGFTITRKNKALEAEVLASMYDSSLDQFKTQDWRSLDISDYYRYYSNYRFSNLSEGHTYIQLQNLNAKLPRFQFSNDKVNLYQFGFDFTNPNTKLGTKASKKATSEIPKNAATVYGTITDDTGLPLPGANIIVKGTIRGTQSDFDGYYSIDVAQGEELEFSYVGFDTQTVSVESNEYNISLAPGSALEEVVVTGYSSDTRTVQTSAVVNVNDESLLQGKVAGVSVTAAKGKPGQGAFVRIRGTGSLTPSANSVLIIVDGVPLEDSGYSVVGENINLSNLNPKNIANINVLKGDEATALYGSRGANGVILITTKSALEELTTVKTRTNFDETAFFEPQLRTDEEGNVSFDFTSPEALTQWKLRLFAHTKNAESGYLENLVITQKDLMIAPNMPRFFREKDSIWISARISNLTSESKSGIAMLQLFDAITMEPVDVEMGNEENFRNFQTAAKGNATLTWKIKIPEGMQGVQYKVVAKSGNFTDGEENLIPVLTNTILVTESIPLWVKEKSKKEYTFENLENQTSTTLKNHRLTLEYTSNPTWLAIQALPYLMEYEHDCSEQVFTRYYANSIAAEILNSNPKIAAYFKSNKPKDLKSELEQNEELKSIILSETPWFNDAQSEEEKHARLALLFDLEKLRNAQQSTFEKLSNQQMSNGAFPWFEGGNENEFITRHIVAGFGKLSKRTDSLSSHYKSITDKAIGFLDGKFRERSKLKKNRTNNYPFPTTHEIHYLYARSFYLESNPMSDSLQMSIDKDLESLKADWLNSSLYQKAMAALIFDRFGDSNTAKMILNNLKETASNNEDWGMYWIANKSGWYWYNAPIETQALLIEAFAEIENDRKSVDAMKVWLLKNKQVKHWPTTKSTSLAIDAMLHYGKDWTNVKDKTNFKLGNSKVLEQKLETIEKEVASGYFKLSFDPSEIQNDMAKLSIHNKSEVPGFGGFYWQYFEEIDKIESQPEKPMSVKKELYLKKNTPNGQQLQKITEDNNLKLGDLVTVRLLISTKEDMEFVHLKDMRASAFEPIDVLSEYIYTDGLGYYKSTRDAATHFFFDKIKKGTYVLEYDVRANNIGNFSNGITTIQSMYAPEYNHHSRGMRIKILE